MKYKVIVAHPGKQHSFRTATALEHNGLLCKYVTSVYDSGSSGLMNAVKSLVHEEDRRRASSRKETELNPGKVVQFCEVSGFLEIALYRFDKSHKFYRWWHNLTADRFGKKVAKLAIKEHADAVIMYDTTAKSCFELLERKAPRIVRIMDMSLANRLYLKEIYRLDMKRSPSFAGRIKIEQGHLWNRKNCKRLLMELSATQFFLAPSIFVRKSLLYSGIRDNQIYLCPYGTNFKPEVCEKNTLHHEKLEVLYVGQIIERKGISYLLKTAQELSDLAEFILVGDYCNDDHVFDPYFRYCRFVGQVLHEEVQQYMREADVFVFPSLGEGFSLAVLEAMSCGLPCIVSENSGANDVIENGVNGFVIKPMSSGAIKEKLLWCCQNRDKLPEMGRKASETASQYTWEAYEKNLISVISELLNKGDKWTD